MYCELRSKVTQKHDWDSTGACLSSLLSLNYDEIPRFIELSEDEWQNYWGTYSTWLLQKFKLIPLIIPVSIKNNNMILPISPVYPYFCIGHLRHPGEKYSHSVVLKVDHDTIKIEWDPADGRTHHTIEDIKEIEIHVNPANQY